MALKPWYTLVNPREDLREGKPLDASEFAVHLEHVKEQRAADVYKKPDQFFERTFLTQSLKGLSASVLRRLSGIKVETSAVYNLTTQFGGGKTHSLTALYHLGTGGSRAIEWRGVRDILHSAKIAEVPEAAVAVFVGHEFDAIDGRGGEDGTPKRHTPWGEIAFQIGGKKAFEAVAQHDAKGIAPAGEVIRKFLPKDKPVLILMDELLNFMGRNRKSGLTNQLYAFMQNLSEEARAQDRLVLAVSLPSLLDEMTPEDEADYGRFEKLLNRVGKSMMMAAETETSEIIRRRLFEWTALPEDAKKTIREYADWIVDNRSQVPSWFPVDNAYEAFQATYPLHPTLLSVFERKWQQLPRFQKTRGILRLLALWISHVFHKSFKKASGDPLISMGSAPLDDPEFRSAVFEQLGSSNLEGAVTTDIDGKKDAHAIRLDKEANDTLKKSRLHRKVATVIFFESNGGQAKAEATLPEVRLAVAEPGLDIGNVETALDTLATTCYYLSNDKNKYRFSPSPNLNKLLSDRQASVQPPRIEERLKAEVKKVFDAIKDKEKKSPDSIRSISLLPFPENSGQIPDHPALTIAYLAPDMPYGELATRAFVQKATKEHGGSSRTFKSALVWAVPDNPKSLQDEARKVLAWEELEDEQSELRLEDAQKRQLAEAVKRARRDVTEAAWRTYKYVMLLGKDGSMKTVDLGLVHSSAASTLVELIVNRLVNDGDILDKPASAIFLVRNWPPAFQEWSTKAARDAFFSSPAFPKLLDGSTIKDTVARGVHDGIVGYVRKTGDGGYSDFYFKTDLSVSNVEIAEDMFIIQKDVAQAYLDQQGKPKPPEPPPGPEPPKPGPGGERPMQSGGGTHPPGPPPLTPPIPPPEPPKAESVTSLSWEGTIPPQKWMNFYMKVLSQFGTEGLGISLRVKIAPPSPIPTQKMEDMKVALRDLGLDDKVEAQSQVDDGSDN